MLRQSVVRKQAQITFSKKKLGCKREIIAHVQAKVIFLFSPQCKNTDSYQNWSKVVQKTKKGKQYYATQFLAGELRERIRQVSRE